ncbi:MAG: TM2 domain-containing protein [Clostridia bacterium]|nr:TM2 domain-containing protein [Clostridia bacterium]
MEQQLVDQYIMTHRTYFPTEKVTYLKDKLIAADEQKFSSVLAAKLKNPIKLLLVSLFLGTFGVDRFMIGDTKMGILKLSTAGVCGTLTIIDWFSIFHKTKNINFNHIMSLLCTKV